MYFNQFIILFKNGVLSHCKKSTDNYEKPYVTLRLWSVIFHFLKKTKTKTTSTTAFSELLFKTYFWELQIYTMIKIILILKNILNKLTLCWWLNRFCEPWTPVLWQGWTGSDLTFSKYRHSLISSEQAMMSVSRYF